MKPNRKKPPPGWRVRVGQMVGHGTFIGHFKMPDGFEFTNDMHQSDLNGRTFRELVVARAWECADLQLTNPTSV